MCIGLIRYQTYVDYSNYGWLFSSSSLKYFDTHILIYLFYNCFEINIDINIQTTHSTIQTLTLTFKIHGHLVFCSVFFCFRNFYQLTAWITSIIQLIIRMDDSIFFFFFFVFSTVKCLTINFIWLRFQDEQWTLLDIAMEFYHGEYFRHRKFLKKLI